VLSLSSGNKKEVDNKALLLHIEIRFLLGSPDDERESLYQGYIKPLISGLHEHRAVQASLHMSGTCIDWLEASHPEIITLITQLVSRKQVEILGGSYHGAALPLIPPPDRIAQLEGLTTRIRRAFGRRPRGAWIDAYAWESNLPSLLQSSGFDYCLLPESHYRLAGKKLDSVIVTEDQGRSIIVLPLHKEAMASALSLGDKEIGPYLASAYSNQRCLSLPLDVSRISQHLTVSRFPSWLEAFYAFAHPIAAQGQVLIPSRYIKQLKSLETGYIGSICDDEIALKFLTKAEKDKYFDTKRRLGKEMDALGVALPSVQRACARYGEARLLRSRMLYTHAQINQFRGDKARKRAARELLWQAQASELYWPELGHGLDSPKARSEAYKSLIEAEGMIRSKSVSSQLLGLDFDSDGHREYVFQGPEYSSFVHSRGAAIVEIDINKDARNILDCAFLEEGRLPRAFQDKVAISFGKGAKRETKTKDFSSTVFEWCLEDKSRAAIACKAETGFPPDLIRGGGLELRKEFSFQRKAIKVSYLFSNQSDQALDVVLESSLFVSLWDPRISIDGSSVDLTKERSTYESASAIELREGRRRIVLSIVVSQPLGIDITRVSRIEYGSLPAFEVELRFSMRFSISPLSIKPLSFDVTIG
jgi:hypothetical protein